jgi:hypothetical protein
MKRPEYSNGFNLYLISLDDQEDKNRARLFSFPDHQTPLMCLAFLLERKEMSMGGRISAQRLVCVSYRTFLFAVEPAITPESPFLLPEKAKISLKSG